MRTVHKFPVLDEAPFPVARGAKPVLVGQQGKEVYVWMEIDTMEPTTLRRFSVIGTGWAVPCGSTHVGSFQAPPYVWHVYELPAPAPAEEPKP